MNSSKSLKYINQIDFFFFFDSPTCDMDKSCKNQFFGTSIPLVGVVAHRVYCMHVSPYRTKLPLHVKLRRFHKFIHSHHLGLFTLLVVLMPTKVCPSGTGLKRLSKKNRPIQGLTWRKAATSRQLGRVADSPRILIILWVDST